MRKGRTDPRDSEAAPTLGTQRPRRPSPPQIPQNSRQHVTAETLNRCPRGRRASDFEYIEYQCVTKTSRADPMIFSGGRHDDAIELVGYQ